MDMLRLARIGGAIWETKSEHGRWVACCDMNTDLLKRVETEFPGVQTCTDYREIAVSPEIDAVYICTPNDVHAEQTIACLEGGKHVFVEKPMALMKEDVVAMVQAERKSGKRLAVDLELRFGALTARRPVEIIQSGEIGKVVGLQFIHYRGGWKNEGNGIWRVQRAKSGGMHMMEAIHPIDLLRFYGGDVSEVQSFSLPNVLPQYDFVDNIMTHLFFENGIRGFVLESHQRSSNAVSDLTGDDPLWQEQGHSYGMSIIGEEGALKLDFWKARLTMLHYETYPTGTDGRQIRFARNESFKGLSTKELYHDMQGYFEEFVRRVAEGETPYQSGEDAARTHLLCLAAEDSANDLTAPRLRVDYSCLL